MTAADLLERVYNLGLRLEPREGDRLAVHPASRLPPELAAELRTHKSEVIGLLRGSTVTLAGARSGGQPFHRGWQSLPPLDLPLVELMPTPTLAQCHLVIAYLRRQCTCQQLRDWLTRRRAAYLTTIGKVWDRCLLSYAVARDAASWQLDRPEPEVWSLLEGVESCLEDLKIASARH